MNAQQKQERREQKLQKEKQRKLKKILEKLAPKTQDLHQDILAIATELTLLRAKMRYLERSDYRAFQDVEKGWDKGFLTDSDEESSSDSD